MAVVLPRFARILGDMGQELPMSTRLVLAGAEYARVLVLPAIGGAVTAFLLWRAWTATVEGRRTWDGWMLAVPGIGGLRMGAASARLCAALSALLASGVPIVPALQHAAAASGNAAVEARALGARAAIAQGERPSRAFAQHAALTEITLRLIHAGEESGRLASMLAHAARLERENTTQRLRSAVRLMEPLMIIGFGGLVALVAASLLQALYSVRPGA